jgi:hypothetical protein
MARKHDEPTAPRGPGTEVLHKHRSTDPEQDRLHPPPARPFARPPASASYDPASGRATRVGDKGADSWRQLPSSGGHTEAPAPKRTNRPGRW